VIDGSKPAPAATAPDEPARPLLERFGLAYFKRRAATLPPVEAMDEVHVLNPDELRELTSIQRWTVARAALVGALSGLASSLAEVLAAPLEPPEDSATMAELGAYYGIVFGVTGVATVLEIGFLYWDALRSVHDLSRAAGLTLFEGGEDDQQAEVAAALARAALELPSPPKGIFNIDPLKESNRFVLVLAALVYKLKIGVTNFVLKALVRRALGRAAVRAWLVFMAVPVTAAWNGIVAFIIMREARIRAMGPSAAKAFAEAILGGERLSDEGRVAVLRAVGANIVRTQELHPNLVAFLLEVHRHVGEPGKEPLDETPRFLEQLARLPSTEQDIALRILSVGAVLDGRVNRRERKLVVSALTACGRDPSSAPLDRLRRAFASGEPIKSEVVNATSGAPLG
jgi:hypothetical protein